MATKKTAQKTSSRSTLNVELNTSKKTQRQMKNTMKNTSVKAWLVGVCFLVVGAILGAGAWFVVCRNDCFELLGNEYVVCTLDQKYEDEGVKAISFGKDVSQTVEVIETNLKVDAQGKYYSDEVGVFYIKYASTDLKYGKIFKVEKVRLVVFVEASEEIDV